MSTFTKFKQTLLDNISDKEITLFASSFREDSPKCIQDILTLLKSSDLSVISDKNLERLSDLLDSSELDSVYKEISGILRNKRRYCRTVEKNKDRTPLTEIEKVQFKIMKTYLEASYPSCLPSTEKGRNAVYRNFVKVLNKTPKEGLDDYSHQFQIFSGDIQDISSIKGLKLKFSDLFVLKDKSYHRNDAKFGTNGYCRKYIFAPIGDELKRKIDISEVAIEIINKLPVVSRDVMEKSIVLPLVNLSKFISLTNFSKLQFEGVHTIGIEKYLIIKDVELSTAFNRTYTTWTTMPSEARKLCSNKEICDIQKHSLNTIYNASQFNWDKNGKRIEGIVRDSNEMSKLYPEFHQLLHVNGYWDIVRSLGQGLNISQKAAKKSLTAASYGSRDKGLLAIILKDIKPSEKALFLAIYKETRWYKVIQEIRACGTYLFKMINYKGSRARFGCPKEKDKSSGKGRLLAYFCSFHEKLFRVLAKQGMGACKLPMLQVHDAIYYPGEIKGKEILIEFITKQYKEYTGLTLRLH